MAIEVLVMIAATVAYNGSTVLLAIGSRRAPEPAGARLFAGVFRRAQGLAGIGLTVVGWTLAGLGMSLLWRRAERRAILQAERHWQS